MSKLGSIDNAIRLYTAAETQQLDRCSIDQHGIPGFELMKRAGAAAFSEICQRFPERKRWAILCGGGNNAGDGYVVGRLAREQGIECQLYCLKKPENLHGDAARAAESFLAQSGDVRTDLPRSLEGFDLIVDALLGTGLDRVPEGRYAEAIRATNASGAAVVAIDIPSGLSADTGVALGGLAVKADLTVTFIGRKRGLHTADGPDYSGDVKFDDLQVPAAVYGAVTNPGFLIYEAMIGNVLVRRPRNSHKGSFGWLVVVGSDLGMSGAVRLCGEAALRSGAGKVTIGTHPEHAMVVNSNCPELMVRGIRTADELDEITEAADAVVLGTGLGRSEWSEDLFDSCWTIPAPLVVDADGLNILSGRKTRDVPQREQTILTPHPAEAARLLGCSPADIQSDRVSAAQSVARNHDAVVVLKGCGTVVANPEGRYAICPLGNPGMATAGTGDVLAGVFGALLCQGLNCWNAAICGVVAHAAAGDRAASLAGERGLMASDVIVNLPNVLNPNHFRNYNS